MLGRRAKGLRCAPMPTLPPPNPDPDPEHRETAQVMAIHLRKTAEGVARREMQRLIEEAKRQEGPAPDHL